MNWHDLAFLHWPVVASELKRLLPPGLTLDLYDGQAWVGIVPFYMDSVRPRFCPHYPAYRAFQS